MSASLMNGQTHPEQQPNWFGASPAAFVHGLDAPVTALDWTEQGSDTFHMTALRSHQRSGFSYNLSGPNCVFRWAQLRRNYSGPVDVIVHFHGYKAHNAMNLGRKAAASGLDLGHVSRPTLGLVPHGHPFPSQTQPGTDGFDFPAIGRRDTLLPFMDAALARLAQAVGARAGSFSRGRLSLTAHSGGGATLTQLLQSFAGNADEICSAHYFDATYGDSRGIYERPRGQPQQQLWIDQALARDAAALQRLGSAEERARHMAGAGRSLRILFIAGTGTRTVGQGADAYIAQKLATLVPDPATRQLLRRYYRAQSLSVPPLDHGAIPSRFGGKLLANLADDLGSQAHDLPAPAARSHAVDVTYALENLNAPSHPAGAPAGSAFIDAILSLRGTERESRIFDQIAAGNIPAFLRTLATVATTATDAAGQRHNIEYYITPDYLSIGDDSAFVRMPMDPVTAQRIADRFDCLLPTAKMVDQIYAAAAVRIPPETRGYAATNPRMQTSSEAYREHSQALDRHFARLGGRPGQLAAGHKKDLVISRGYTVRTRTGQTRGVLAFYGWFTTAGVPIQASPLSDPVNKRRGIPVLAHEPSYVDYSHGVRLVAKRMKVDGREMEVAAVLRDGNLSKLIAVEGPIANPRFTLDRSGRPATAGAQAIDGDPLGLAADAGAVVETLGYGTDWDQRIRADVEAFLAAFSAIRVTAGGTAVSVHPPYFINVGTITSVAQCPANPTGSAARLCAAFRHRAAAPALLKRLIDGLAWCARHGKGEIADIQRFLQAALDAGHVRGVLNLTGDPSATDCRNFLVRYGIGIDCSGFVSQSLNRLTALTGAAQRLDICNTNAASLKGASANFTVAGRPADLRPGDTMWRTGHIRILSSAERRGDSYYFQTAESSSRADVGPTPGYWRLRPRQGGSGSSFPGFQLQRGPSLQAPEASWRDDGDTVVFSHYTPLVNGLRGRGATPVSLALDEYAPVQDDHYAPALETLTRARVTSLVEACLRSFQAIEVHAADSGGTRRSHRAHTPYFINRPTSPSYRRAGERRPALLRNAALARLYQGLPAHAKIGKSTVSHIRGFLQGVLDANAVPGQASALTDASLKAFLSDVGVGVDCSGFVSQVLNAFMEAAGRSERIHAGSSQLKGGSGGNSRAFDVVARPRDLLPGDTMWKQGHIRILSRVTVAADGSVEFVTAESSSVDLIGVTAKTWRYPDGASFRGGQVRRGQNWAANGETNVYSRYRPLAAVMERPAAAGHAADEAALGWDNETERAFSYEEALSPTVHAFTTTGPTQSEVDRLARITFGNAADINAFFARSGGTGFADWFNATLGGRPPFVRGGRGGGLRMPTSAAALTRFNNYWNGIPHAFDRPRITALDFAALMCIVLNETGGDFSSNPERCSNSRDARGNHPGLAYAFDRVESVKASYNTLAGNRTAGQLFNDADYINAHRALGGSSTLIGHGNDWGGAWNSAYYPQRNFSTAEDPAVNGFIMQADFYKFRGRGVIQTTSRRAYEAAIRFIQSYGGADTTLLGYKRRWTGMTPSVAATVSTTSDWDTIFGCGDMLARALALHSGSGAQDYRQMSTDAAILNHVPPIPAQGTPRGTQHSIYFMGRRISGNKRYAAGTYRDRVIKLMQAILVMP